SSDEWQMTATGTQNPGPWNGISSGDNMCSSGASGTAQAPGALLRGGNFHDGRDSGESLSLSEPTAVSAHRRSSRRLNGPVAYFANPQRLISLFGSHGVSRRVRDAR